MKQADKRALEAYPIDSYEGHDDMYRQRGAFVKGYNQASKDYIEYAQLWVDSGEVNIKSFKQFLKDRGYE